MMTNNDDQNKGGFVVHIYSPGNQVIQTQNNNYYGPVYQGKAAVTENNSFTDKQIAVALLACVGDDKVINLKWKWVGAYWYLRHACHFPMDPKKFCDRIKALPYGRELPIKCEYRNIREYTTLSFMDEDPTDMDKVKYSSSDFNVFKQCSEIALKLAEELGKSYLLKE